MNGRNWIAWGALMAAMAVAAGAMGTHYLREVQHAAEPDLQTYEVAVRYQMYHALALVLVGLAVGPAKSRWLSAAGAAFLLGIVLFCGGLYGWLLTDIKPFIHVVPVGGMAWTLGWLMFAIGMLGWRQAGPETLRQGTPDIRPRIGRRGCQADFKRPRTLPAPWPIACGPRAAGA